MGISPVRNAAVVSLFEHMNRTLKVITIPISVIYTAAVMALFLFSLAPPRPVAWAYLGFVMIFAVVRGVLLNTYSTLNRILISGSTLLFVFLSIKNALRIEPGSVLKGLELTLYGEMVPYAPFVAAGTAEFMIRASQFAALVIYCFFKIKGGRDFVVSGKVYITRNTLPFFYLFCLIFLLVVASVIYGIFAGNEFNACWTIVYKQDPLWIVELSAYALVNIYLEAKEMLKFSTTADEEAHRKYSQTSD